MYNIFPLYRSLFGCLTNVITAITSELLSKNIASIQDEFLWLQVKQFERNCRASSLPLNICASSVRHLDRRLLVAAKEYLTYYLILSEGLFLLDDASHLIYLCQSLCVHVDSFQREWKWLCKSLIPFTPRMPRYVGSRFDKLTK